MSCVNMPTSTDLLHMAQSSSLSEICNVKVVDFVVIFEKIMKNFVDFVKNVVIDVFSRDPKCDVENSK